MAKKTWASQLRNVHLFSETQDWALGTEVVAPLSESELLRHDRSDGGWKDYAIVKKLYELQPETQWYLIIDDDSYVIVPTFLCVLRTTIWNDKLVYSGLGFQTDVGQQGFEGYEDVGFAVGGPGILLSRSLVQLLSRLRSPFSSADVENEGAVHKLKRGVSSTLASIFGVGHLFNYNQGSVFCFWKRGPRGRAA